MTQQASLPRREIINAAGMFSLASAASISPAWAAIDLADPKEGYRAYVKLRGSLGDEWVFRHYWGDVYAVLPERLPVPMFKFQGLIKAKWTNNGDGTHSELLYDVSSFLDWTTGAILDVFDNPISGEKNDVIQVWDGPSHTHIQLQGRFIHGRSSRPLSPCLCPGALRMTTSG